MGLCIFIEKHSYSIYYQFVDWVVGHFVLQDYCGCYHGGSSLSIDDFNDLMISTKISHNISSVFKRRRLRVRPIFDIGILYVVVYVVKISSCICGIEIASVSTGSLRMSLISEVVVVRILHVIVYVVEVLPVVEFNSQRVSLVPIGKGLVYQISRFSSSNSSFY